jgi:hypothetical protein
MDNLCRTPRVFCIGTADTKLDELKFLSECVRSNINSFTAISSFKVPSLHENSNNFVSLYNLKLEMYILLKLS